MSNSTEFCRKLFLLTGDLMDSQRLLGELQNELLDLKGESEYEEFQAEITALKPTFDRVLREYSQLFEACQEEQS